MSRKAYVTDETRAHAVARVIQGGENVKTVARDIGMSRSAVTKWVREAGQMAGQGYNHEAVNRSIEEMTERIKQRQTEVRELLIQRIAELIPKTNTVKDLGTVYGIVTDKALLAEGKPTSIYQENYNESANSVEEMEQLADELRKRREQLEEAS